jgi:hypothetical protein
VNSCFFTYQANGKYEDILYLYNEIYFKMNWIKLWKKPRDYIQIGIMMMIFNHVIFNNSLKYIKNDFLFFYFPASGCDIDEFETRLRASRMGFGN